MFGLIGLGINAIVLVLLFGVMAKLDDLSKAVKALGGTQASTADGTQAAPTEKG